MIIGKNVKTPPAVWPPLYLRNNTVRVCLRRKNIMLKRLSHRRRQYNNIIISNKWSLFSFHIGSNSWMNDLLLLFCLIIIYYIIITKTDYWSDFGHQSTFASKGDVGSGRCHVTIILLWSI